MRKIPMYYVFYKGEIKHTALFLMDAIDYCKLCDGDKITDNNGNEWTNIHELVTAKNIFCKEVDIIMLG